MNDDKHNDVWVSSFHGNSTGLGMVSHRVLFLGQLTERKHQVIWARNIFLQIMFTMVYAMTQNGWLTLIICRDKNLKSCKQSEHIFHYLSRLITEQTLENNSSSSNLHAKFSQKSQTRAQVALFCHQPQPSSQQAGI